MEHLYDSDFLSEKTGITDTLKLRQLIDYSQKIFSENKKYNLTGHKTLSDIIDNLIIGSLSPMSAHNVPRGTLCADIGTGAGIPGVPMAIKNNDSSFVLFDSNQKKIRFINNSVSELGITNVKASDSRVEDAGRNVEYREKFDVVFTRAMSDIYTVSELASPLLKTGGYIYLYVHREQLNINNYISEHLSDLGLVIKPLEHVTDGLCLLKNRSTDDKYPRRITVIKRLSNKTG